MLLIEAAVVPTYIEVKGVGFVTGDDATIFSLQQVVV
jgi:hypothetical protein